MRKSQYCDLHVVAERLPQFACPELLLMKPRVVPASFRHVNGNNWKPAALFVILHEMYAMAHG